MEKKHKGSLYDRYSISELIFKVFINKLLRFSFTKKIAFRLLKGILSNPENTICKMIHKIYFSGTTQHDAQRSAISLFKKGIFSILDYASEGNDDEIAFDTTVENIISNIKSSACLDYVPYIAVKPTSIGAARIYRFKCHENEMDEDSIEAWDRITLRFRRIFDIATCYRVRIMIDAEQTSIQPAVDKLMISMMQTYNRDWPVINLTLQFYLKAQQKKLESYYIQSHKYNFILGLKVVRGAYLEHERNSYGKHLCFNSKHETDESFNKATTYISERLDRIYPFFATHNEVSLEKIMLNDNLRFAKVWTGQLYGMSDHLSYYLVNSDLRVCKYLPYGPIKTSLPYLIRRIEENALAPETFKKENIFLFHEIKCRLTGGQSARI